MKKDKGKEDRGSKSKERREQKEEVFESERKIKGVKEEAEV